MRYFFCFLLFFLCCAVHAQEPGIFSQDLKGVKSMKYYISSTDSNGKVQKKRELITEHLLDTAGRVTRILHYADGKYVHTEDFIYDSLGRIQVYISWTKKTGNVKSVYQYETDSTGRFTIVRTKNKDGVTRVESSYFDTLRHRRIVSQWLGTSTLGAADQQHQYDSTGKLAQRSSYNGFTEYRYDSAGTLVYMLVRQFEDGHCSAYIPIHYQCTYSNGRLTTWEGKTSSVTFEYDAHGKILRQISRSGNSNEVLVDEAEYTYY